MYENLLRTVMNLGSPEVLLVGDFMLDAYVYGDALKISPEAPVPVLRVTGTEHRCGGAGSVAANLATLGATVHCLGVIGDDPNGQVLKEELTECGVHIGGLMEAVDRPTISKQRVIGLAQHLHRQQLIRVDQESQKPISDEINEAILRAYEDRLPGTDIVCLQDYNKGLLSDELCRQMIRLANEAGKPIIADPSLTSNHLKYACATVITPNRQESSAMVGFEVTSAETAAKAADHLLRELELEGVVITLDKEGAYFKTKTERPGGLIPTRPRSVYDVTGAGDMVLAMLTMALAAGCEYETAVKLSNVAGGIEIGKFGAVTVTTEEIADEIAHQNRDASGKVRSVDSLLCEIERHRRQKRTIVFTNGCFDVLHRGHLEYLRFCRRQGDVVVLGLNSDRSVKMIKGPSRPINNQDDRAALLAAMEMIDYVTFFDEPDPLSLIEKVRPDVLIKGEDWAVKGVVGREFVESYDGKVILAPLVEGRSSTLTIEKMNSKAKSL
ncbi:MAG: bifunctional heptose 7-phosphate kinase/heptose 1-phosphate adenyltransferase [Sedimentisphaerales bacterium]|jgi:D-beta-D-heptose 7-phosphate kinase/D-beta-D-heptose 1-phosphate adenosyltransferase